MTTTTIPLTPMFTRCASELRRFWERADEGYEMDGAMCGFDPDCMALVGKGTEDDALAILHDHGYTVASFNAEYAARTSPRFAYMNDLTRGVIDEADCPRCHTRRAVQERRVIDSADPTE